LVVGSLGSPLALIWLVVLVPSTLRVAMFGSLANGSE
jgi:hypothetical protein